MRSEDVFKQREQLLLAFRLAPVKAVDDNEDQIFERRDGLA